MVGLDLDPWQQLVVRDVFAIRGDGKWAAFELALLCARQNGKGAVLEAIALADLYLFGSKLILHSAHEFKTAAEAFLRVKALIDGSDYLMSKVKVLRTSHGEEGVELLNGHRLRFVARSRSSGRGFSADRTILDEAQELPRSAMSALLPTLRTRPNPQVIYTGTVPSPENQSEHWESVRDRGRAGGDKTLAWLEWSAGERLDDLDDRDAWAAANPALGHRLDEEAMERERATLDDEGFARELLSLWGPLSAQTVIDMDTWVSLADPTSQVLDPVTFSVDVSPDRKRAAISVAGRRKDGLLHGEVIENAAGTTWAVSRLVGLLGSHKGSRLALDGGGPAGGLLAPLQEAGVEPVLLTTRDVTQGCAALLDLVNERGLRVLPDPRLTTAVAAGRKRTVGEAWAWHRRDTTTDITPLVALTNALHGARQVVAAPPSHRNRGRARNY